LDPCFITKLNAGSYITNILHQFLAQLMEAEELQGFFHQDSATPDVAHATLEAL
jgi:hypothetical protein